MLVKRFSDISSEAMKGSVIVCPTDTIYGLSARVGDAEAIARVRALKGKKQALGLIVLIPDATSLTDFGVELNDSRQYLLSKVWPGPVSVVLPVSKKWSHVAAADTTISFRMPNSLELLDFIRRVGPIISTSANKTGERPAASIEGAQAIFGDGADIYVDGGKREGASSTIIKILR